MVNQRENISDIQNSIFSSSIPGQITVLSDRITVLIGNMTISMPPHITYIKIPIFIKDALDSL
jgi:hypothetical protein